MGVWFKSNQKKIYLVLLIVLLIIGFVLRCFPFTNGHLTEDSPAVRTTYDAFFHVYISKGVYNQEEMRHWPAFATTGIKTVNFQPPLLYVFMASFAKLANFSSFYRLFFFLICFFMVWTIFQVYVILAKFFNEEIALLGSVFALFPTYNWLMFLVMGFSMDIFAFLMIPCFLFFSIRFINTHKNIYAFLSGLLLGASFLTHILEALFAGISIALIFLVFLILKKMSFKQVIVFGVCSLTTFFISVFYFLPLWFSGYGGHGGESASYLFKLGRVGKPPSYFWPLSYHWILILGFLFLGFYLFKNYDNIYKNNKKFAVLLFILINLLLAFSWLIGMSGNRARRWHFLMYNFIAFLPGIGFYFLLGALKHRFWRFIVALAFIVVMLFAFMPSTYKKLHSINSNTMFTDDKWEAIRFIRDHTPENTTFFALSGYYHQFPKFSERVPFYGDFGRDYTIDNYKKLCNRTMPAYWHGIFGIENYYKNSSRLAVARKGLFGFETVPVNYRFKQNQTKALESTFMKIQDFDYVVLPYRGSPVQKCLNVAILNLTKEGYPVVFKNPTMVVFKVV